MRRPLSDLDGRAFDVVVIGGGAVGASSAQHLAAAGQTTLVVDKADFASGTSSRLLYSGLAYLSPDSELWRFLYRPRDLYRRIRMAKLAMGCRTELASTMPERVGRHTFFFPVHEGDEHPGWKVDLGYRALGLFGSSKVPLNHRRLPAAETVADVLGWDEARIDREVAQYRRFVAENFEPRALARGDVGAEVSA